MLSTGRSTPSPTRRESSELCAHRQGCAREPSEASPQTDESCRMPDGLDSLIETVKSRLACRVRSYSPRGISPLKGTHRLHSCRPPVNPWLEAFGALLPPQRRRVRGRDVLSKSPTFKQNLTLLLQIFRCKYSNLPRQFSYHDPDQFAKSAF
jgi:hypothetical protein